ncbi:hypothetical protein L6452_24002 [Arctium lappa]|uniref:Uncharacterized protein n=1 Tax=Arctium lappa TaxID=4217 RepID=A0ACB9A816_ARCLA|nr:hypothetical protein L6452_24002 [Arctium lappa]
MSLLDFPLLFSSLLYLIPLLFLEARDTSGKEKGQIEEREGKGGKVAMEIEGSCERKVIAQNLQKIDPKSDGAKRDWVAIYDECANVLYQEIDYNKEAANAELFARYRVAAKLGKGQSVKSLQGDYVAWKGVVPTVGAGLKSIWDAAVVFLVDGYGDRSHNFSMLSLLLPVVLLFAVVVNLPHPPSVREATPSINLLCKSDGDGARGWFLLDIVLNMCCLQDLGNPPVSRHQNDFGLNNLVMLLLRFKSYLLSFLDMGNLGFKSASFSQKLPAPFAPFHDLLYAYGKMKMWV